MPFRPGDHVHVTNLGKGIVREVRSRERYLVDIKERAMILAEGQLRAVEDRKCQPKNPVAPRPTELSGTSPRAHVRDNLDLHGMTAAEAMAALDAFLNDALLASLGEVRVIHGRSGGRLKAAVHQRLRELPPIRSFRLDPVNPGVTIVAL